MSLIFKLAWRNLWRNKRRTLITAASVFVSVVLALYMRSMQLGSYDKMVRDVVENYTGYLQVHAQGYWDDKTINNTFTIQERLRDTLRQVDGVTRMIPRLESFALVSSGPHSKGAMVIGTAPREEERLTSLAEKVVRGSYLDENDGGILVAEKLADFLQVDTSDTVVLLGQGYHGVSAIGKYPVRGVLSFASPDLNRQMLYMTLEQAQQLYYAPDRLTSLAFDIRNRGQLDAVRARIEEVLPQERFEVMTWREMLTSLVQQIEADNVGGIIMLGILYLIVAFGIFGTIVMMTLERRREFGVVTAVGMNRGRLTLMLFVETVMIALMGVAAGVLVAIPLILYFYYNPIRLTGAAAETMVNMGVEPVLPMSLDPMIFVNQSLILFVVALLCFLYPFYTIRRLKPVEALRS
jgi:ABC-type lipoprotein release transport system permease subunit